MHDTDPSPEPGCNDDVQTDEPHGTQGTRQEPHSPESDGPNDDVDDGQMLDNVIPNLKIEDVQMTQQFIQALWNASLHNGDLSEHSIDYLLNSPTEPLVLDEDADCWLLMCLRIFVGLSKASDDCYTSTINAMKHAFTGPLPVVELHSFNQIK